MRPRTIKVQRERLEKHYLKKVREDCFSIQRMRNPSEAVQLAAVEINGTTVRFIREPSEAVQLAAVHQARDAIYLIELIARRRASDTVWMVGALRWGVTRA